MAEYKQMSIYFDLEKPDEAWVYQYLMSLRHGEKQGGILTEGKSRGLSDRKPVESVLPDAMLSPIGKDISVQEDGKGESDWRIFFTQEQFAAILEKNLDMSQLTEDSVRQMAGQVQNGIPARAAYKETLMWCQ